MKPTREQCLKWAKDTKLIYGFEFDVPVEELEALCQRVWNEAIEAAAIETDFCVGQVERDFAREAILGLKVKP